MSSTHAMTVIRLPNAIQVSQYWSKLLRRDIEVTDVRSPAMARLTHGATYHDGDNVVVGGCATDIDLAAYASAAFCLIPPDAARENIQKRALDDLLRETYAEMMNVMTRVFDAPVDTRIALLQTYLPPDALPASITGPRTAPSKSAGFEVEIDGYGKGTLFLCSVA